ncbi:MAG: hypothetical protein AAF417_05815 [Pseudomonadota bacterium]
MTLSDLARELGFPLRQGTLAIGIVVFYLFIQLALAAGLFGLWLAIVILPAMVRFLLGVSESRIYGVPLSPPGIEQFNWLASPASLMAMLWLGAAAWAVVTTALTVGGSAALGVGTIALLVLPAPLGALALSRSALASVNPFALVAIVRKCGWNYLWIPASVSLVFALAMLLRAGGVPSLIIDLLMMYGVFLLFTLTGGVAAERGAAVLIEDPQAMEPDPELEIERLDKEREAVLNHAYGLISRGNREGGLAHIDGFLATSDFVLEDYAWFFDGMMRWERTDAALYFAQAYLTALLDSGHEIAALKLLSRCGRENASFRPAARDRERMRAVVDAHGRADLSGFIGSDSPRNA